MEHLIDNLQCKVPLLIVLATLFSTELLYICGMPLAFDFARSFDVMLTAIIVCQAMFLILMKNETKRLQHKLHTLRLTNKRTVQQFQSHKKKSTEEAINALIADPRYQALQQLQQQQQYSRRSPSADRRSNDSSSDESEETPLTCHQLATKKKLF